MTDAAPVTVCANCGVSAPGAFCPACGQKSEPLRLPVTHVARDSFTEVFGLDGRFWRTLGALLVRPGALTVAFAEGRRTRYLRPLRVYLTSTLLFFFVLTVLDPAASVDRAIRGDGDSTATAAARLADVDAALGAPDLGGAERAADSLGARLDTLRDALDGTRIRRGDPERRDSLQNLADAADDALGDLRRESARSDSAGERRRLALERTVLASFPPDTLIRPADVERAAAAVYPDTADIDMPEWLGRGAAIRAFKQAGTSAERAEAGAVLARAAIGKVPTVMFLLLPLFALLLKLLYVRRGWYYTEHLVFGLHTHAFAFVTFAAIAVLLSLGRPWANGLSLVLALLIPAYFVAAQKRVYGQSWRKTLVKAVLLSGGYYTVLLFGIVGVFVLAAFAG